jgi:raffinose/stachyose/melibiose transport system permease protein
MTATVAAPERPLPPPVDDHHRRRLSVGTPLTYLVAILVAGFAIGPLVYVVIGGFRTTGQLALQPLGLPNPWVTSNYTDVLLSGTFWRQVFNSVLIAVIATVLVVGCGSLAAFALSRYEFRGREGLNSFFTLGLLFPAGVAILPLYLLLRNLHLLDTPCAVAIPQAAFGLPVTIIILRPFMRTIPVELEDAAMIDGCTRLGFFCSWNGYLLPLLVLSDPSQFTLPLGTATFSSQYSSDTAKILAFTALSMLPALAFFLLAERRIVGGLTGSVKG